MTLETVDGMTLEALEDKMSFEAVGEEMTIEPASFNKITDTSSVNFSSMPHCSDTPPQEVFDNDKIEDNIHISNNPDIEFNVHNVSSIEDDKFPCTDCGNSFITHRNL